MDVAIAVTSPLMTSAYESVVPVGIAAIFLISTIIDRNSNLTFFPTLSVAISATADGNTTPTPRGTSASSRD